MLHLVLAAVCREAYPMESEEKHILFYSPLSQNGDVDQHPNYLLSDSPKEALSTA